MPNHVTNIITYEGDRKQIAEMLEAIKNDELGIGIEDLLQGIMDIIGAAAADDLPAEIRGGVDDQVHLVQLHHFGIIQVGGNGEGTQPFLQVADDLGPDVCG